MSQFVTESIPDKQSGVGGPSSCRALYVTALKTKKCTYSLKRGCSLVAIAGTSRAAAALSAWDIRVVCWLTVGHFVL